MKKILLIAFSLITVACFGQAASSDEVVNALKAGNSAAFTSYFDNTIDLKLPDKNEDKGVAKDAAGTTVKGFFSANSVKAFEPTSQRALGGTVYLAGKLTGAKAYNLTVMMKEKDGKTYVITVRIN